MASVRLNGKKICTFKWQGKSLNGKTKVYV